MANMKRRAMLNKMQFHVIQIHLQILKVMPQKSDTIYNYKKGPDESVYIQGIAERGVCKIMSLQACMQSKKRLVCRYDEHEVISFRSAEQNSHILSFGVS